MNLLGWYGLGLTCRKLRVEGPRRILLTLTMFLSAASGIHWYTCSLINLRLQPRAVYFRDGSDWMLIIVR